MIQRDASYYDLVAHGLGSSPFQEFVNKFELKYNEPQTDGFTWDSEIQIDFTYQQLQAELGIATLPTYVDIDSPAPYKHQEGFIVGTNKIPRFKHGFAMNEKIIREQMLMVKRFGQSAITDATKNSLLSLLFDSVDKLLNGNQNALTYQRMQVVSTGQYAITADNNPQGINGLTFDFGIPTANKKTLTGTALWWTNATHITANEGSTSDPIKDLKDRRIMADKSGVPMGHFEMAINLFDDLLMHSKVLKRVGLSLNPASTEAEAVLVGQNMTDDAVKAAIERLIGAKIVVRDSVAVVEKYNKVTHKMDKVKLDSFSPLNVAYVPNGILGTIKAVEPIVIPDPAARVAYYDGGRTVLKQTFNTSTNTQYIESECTALVVPNASQYMFIDTVTV